MLVSHNICFVTTTRADYGLISGLMRAMRADSQFDVGLIVLGTHLSPLYGQTIREIEHDDVPILYRKDTAPEGDDAGSSVASYLATSAALSDYFVSNGLPDALCIAGDRYEMLGVAAVATLYKVPIIHLYGGDETLGAHDNHIRHAITKLSHVHFCSCESSASRVRSMGENPDHIVVSGSPALDSFRTVAPLSKAQLEADHAFTFGEKTVLVSMHPATNASYDPRDELEAMLAALAMLPEDVYCIFTASNADSLGKHFTEKFQSFAHEKPSQCFFVPSFGHAGFVNMMRHADVICGNSSSGVLEAPSMSLWTINIGERQQGREQASSVRDVPPEKDAIFAALSAALQTPPAHVVNPYGDGTAIPRIIDYLKTIEDFTTLRQKPFFG